MQSQTGIGLPERTLLQSFFEMMYLIGEKHTNKQH